MALKLKYTDEHGILHINMSPTSSARSERPSESTEPAKTDITDPKFDTINNRFSQYDLFGGKYDDVSGGEDTERGSLFRSRYNSIEEELANTPYAFTADRTLHLNNNSLLDITIKSRGLTDTSPSKDIEDDRFFNRQLTYDDDLFGPQLDFDKSEDPPAFTVTQLIHAQDRYFDLSSRQSTAGIDKNANATVKSDSVKSLKSKFEFRSAPNSAKREKTVTIVEGDSRVRTESGVKRDAFKVLGADVVKTEVEVKTAVCPVTPLSKRKRERSFAILAETPPASRPTSPRSLPVDTRTGRVSPFRGRGFREETSRHSTPKTSAANSRSTSPLRRRTNSLSRIDKMAQTATLPPPIHMIPRPHSPRNFVKQNIEEVRELSELNREKHEAEAEIQRVKEEEALLKEMGLLDKNAKLDGSISVIGSRTNSRSNSPSKIKLRSRSNSPAAILHFENITTGSKEHINADDGMSKPVLHKSRMRSVSRSQPQSNNGSPKHSKIPKRQNSVSPTRTINRWEASKRHDSNLNRNQRFISSSTSSIHETIKLGSSVHDKRVMSKSSQHLSISPAHIKSKPPISPGRGGPPPSNRTINAKRLSPIVGTPNKSPIDDSKPNSARTPTKPAIGAKKPLKTNTTSMSRLNAKQPSKSVSRDTSPDKRKTNAAKTPVSISNRNATTKPVNRTPSTKSPQKPSIPPKTEAKKQITRTNSTKTLYRTPSSKTLNEKPALKKSDSKRDLTVKTQSTNNTNEVAPKKELNNSKNDLKVNKKAEDKTTPKQDLKNIENKETKTADTSVNDADEISKQDIQTQFDSITNDKGELVILTKKSIVSMTTAAITAQPLEVVTTVTNQLPAALEKAREKGMFERHGSKDFIAAKPVDEIEIEDTDAKIQPVIEKEDQKKANQEKTVKEQIPKEAQPKEPVKEAPKETIVKEHHPKSVFTEDNIKLRPLQPPYNNPQVERAKQKIDDILKAPEVSPKNILVPAAKETKSTFRNIADKTKTDIKDAKNEVTTKFTDIKNQAMKESVKAATDIRSEASKIVDSIITPIEEPKVVVEKKKEEIKKDIEPIVTVVNEKRPNGPNKSEAIKITETLVKGEADVEVQSSNVSTPASKMGVQNKMADGNLSDKSSHSNGGFPQSTSTTPKPPARAHRPNQPSLKSDEKDKEIATDDMEQTKKQNIAHRLLGKCAQKTKCCACCVKPEIDDDEVTKPENADKMAAKPGLMHKLNCCKTKEVDAKEKMVKEMELAAGKVSIDFEDETKRKRTFRDILCGCCGRRRRVSDASSADLGQLGPGGCCGRRRHGVERRDSILSDKPPNKCCTRGVTNWLLGACRRAPPPSRRPSMFSKNKSLSPTLPPEDTRPKLDTSLIEHTSVMRGAIPVLPPALAYICLVCNVIVPGLGTILSGMFCLCFGIPRFGAHDGAKHRIGAFVMNILVGCGQLFTVLFCLVGWGWAIWWGAIMVRVARKYRKLRAEAAAEEEQQAPPVTANNHTAA